MAGNEEPAELVGVVGCIIGERKRRQVGILYDRADETQADNGTELSTTMTGVIVAVVV